MGENVQLSTYYFKEHFLHNELWIVAHRQMENAEKNPIGAFHDHLACMIFSFHAFEAYLNFIGDWIAPHIWREERRYFQKNGGVLGKVRKICEIVRLDEPSSIHRPYKTVLALKNFRDGIAHARTESFCGKIEHEKNIEPEIPSSELLAIVNEENARMAIADIEEFANLIHGATRALDAENPDWFQEREAFSGIVSRSSMATGKAIGFGEDIGVRTVGSLPLCGEG